MKRTTLMAATVAMISSTAFAANKIEGVTIAPTSIKAGSSVTITVAGDETQGNNCGFRINYGDGDGLDVKVVNRDQFPRTFTKTYAQPGNYTISAEGKKVTSHFACNGGAKATLVVEAAAPGTAPAAAPAVLSAPAPVPVPAKSGARVTGSCPTGYQASYVAADGSYGCKPPAGTAVKSVNLVCPVGFSGSILTSDGSVLCKPIPKPAPKPKPKTQCPPDLIYFENPDGAFGCRKPAGK